MVFMFLWKPEERFPKLMQSVILKLSYKTIFLFMFILGKLHLHFRFSKLSISLLSFQIVLVMVSIKTLYDYYIKEFNF